jgi:hypothetical protein
MIKGVPLGTVMAWLSWSSTGMPPARTRTAEVTQLAVTQGVGTALGAKGQPATM